jgi:hypothetical protein
MEEKKEGPGPAARGAQEGTHPGASGAVAAPPAMGRCAAWQRSRGGRRVGRPAATVNFLFSIGFKFETVKRWSSVAQKFSYQIWTCRELNKEQLSPLEFFQNSGWNLT